jgi:hypothetical protein
VNKTGVATTWLAFACYAGSEKCYLTWELINKDMSAACVSSFSVAPRARLA